MWFTIRSSRYIECLCLQFIMNFNTYVGNSMDLQYLKHFLICVSEPWNITSVKIWIDLKNDLTQITKTINATIILIFLGQRSHSSLVAVGTWWDSTGCQRRVATGACRRNQYPGVPLSRFFAVQKDRSGRILIVNSVFEWECIN